MVTYAAVKKGMEHKEEQRQALVESWCKHWSCCGWWKNISGRSKVEQWRNQACSHSYYRVTLVWRHHLVSQSVSRKSWWTKTFQKNSYQRFVVDLNGQYCLDATKQTLSSFWYNILGQEIPNLNDPYICMQ